MNKAIAVIAKILTSLPGSKLTTHILDLSFDGSEEAVELKYSHRDDTRTFRGPTAIACMSKLATSYLVEDSTKNVFGSNVFNYVELRVIVAKDTDAIGRRYASIETMRLPGDIKVGPNVGIDAFHLDDFKVTNGGYLSARLTFPRRYRVLESIAHAQSHSGRNNEVNAFKFHPRTAIKFGETEFITYDLEII